MINKRRRWAAEATQPPTSSCTREQVSVLLAHSYIQHTVTRHAQRSDTRMVVYSLIVSNTDRWARLCTPRYSSPRLPRTHATHTTHTHANNTTAHQNPSYKCGRWQPSTAGASARFSSLTTNLVCASRGHRNVANTARKHARTHTQICPSDHYSQSKKAHQEAGY